MLYKQNQYGELSDETVASAVNLKLVEPDVWDTFCRFQEALASPYIKASGRLSVEDNERIVAIATQLTTAASILAAAPNK